jgi:POT family proton-dependent oligopeptide transporter
VIFPILYDVLLGIGFLYYWPVLLALVSRAAPAKLKATLMGAVFLTLFVANFIIGYIGGFYERMTPAAFWGMEAVIAAIGGVFALVLSGPVKRALALKDA